MYKDSCPISLKKKKKLLPHPPPHPLTKRSLFPLGTPYSLPPKKITGRRKASSPSTPLYKRKKKKKIPLPHPNPLLITPFPTKKPALP